MSNTTHDKGRHVLHGAAWEAPAVPIAPAAPVIAAAGAGAASADPTPPGMQGWVLLDKDGSPSGMKILLDGTGDYPERGLWVFDTTPGSMITDAWLTVYLPAELRLTWRVVGEPGGWTTPTRSTTAPEISGMAAYTSHYTGEWRHVAGAPAYSYAVGRPAFATRSRSRRYCASGQLPAYTHRSVTVDGETIRSQRGPVGL